jgi:hypothetical protein
MGYHFYTYYVVRIEYKNGKKVKVKEYKLEESTERHYFWEDFEEINVININSFLKN